MGSVILENTDDFIAPSQACVNPLFTAARTPGDDKKTKGSVGDIGREATENGGVAPSARRKTGRRRRPLPQSAPVAINATKAEEGGGAPQEKRGSDAREQQPPAVSLNDATRASDAATAPVGGGGASSSPQRKKAATGADGSLTAPVAASATVTTAAAAVVRSRRTRPTKMALAYAHRDEDGDPAVKSAVDDLTAAEKKGAAATVSVADCLACSGCVTSAEAVLVESHSADALKRECGKGSGGAEKGRRRVAFTVSPACVADLTRHLYLEGRGGAGERSSETNADPRTLFRRLASYLHAQYGASLILDGALPRDVSLIESAEEFCHRYRLLTTAQRDANGKGGSSKRIDMSTGDQKNRIDMATPSIALSSTETRYLLQNTADPKAETEAVTLRHPPGRDVRLDESASDFPVLSSSCPGFVCYVEKTAPHAVPKLGTARSPMAVAGALIKRVCAPPRAGGDDGTEDGEVYHVAIMPCHDKKLEAGRRDLAWEQTVLEGDGGAASASPPSSSGDGELSADVDLVITTTELLQLLIEAAAAGEVAESGSDGSNSSGAKVRAYLESFPPVEAQGGFPEGALWGDANAGPRLLLGEDSTRSPADDDADPGTAVAKKKAEEGSQLIGSGAYAEYIFRYAALRLFGHHIPEWEALPWKRVGAAGESNGGGGGAVVRRRRVRRSASTAGGIAAAAHSDMVEVGLHSLPDGTYSMSPPAADASKEGETVEPVLRFAAAYGFKNVQLVLQGLAKGRKSRHHFVEVMACPSGCLNGGGQIRESAGTIDRPGVVPAAGGDGGEEPVVAPAKAGGRRETPAQTRERVRRNAKAMGELAPCPPIEEAGCGGAEAGAEGGRVRTSFLYGGGEGDENPGPLCAEPFGAGAREMLHTRFHAVPKLELTTGATAGVAVEDTKW